MSSSIASSAPVLVGDKINGKALYESSEQFCSGCHGIDGKSTAFTNGKIIDANKTNYAGKTLADYITSNMPFGGVGKCNGQCGADIAAYIVSWLTPSLTESAYTPAVSNPTHSISFLQNCGLGVSAPTNGYNFIGDYDTTQSNQAVSLGNTWNHTTNGSNIEWLNTKFPTNSSTYAIPTNGKANSSCNNVDTVDVLLVKKYADWDHQHANGLQPTNLKSKNINLGKIAFVVIDLKVNSARTSIPTQATLINTYKSYTAESSITAIDKSYVNLGITLTDDGTSTILGATDIIEINQTMFQDQWIRVAIDMSKVNYYSEANYYRAPKTAAELANTIINQLTVVAETGNGTVMRNVITNWNTASPPPETFKELDISIKKLELIYK